MSKSKVAIIRTTPQTVIEDYQKLCELAGIRDALNPEKTTILKDNISWHLPMPGANTTPWQLEGTIKALKQAGFADLVAVENKTVVTRPKYGERSNKYDLVYKNIRSR